MKKYALCPLLLSWVAPLACGGDDSAPNGDDPHVVALEGPCPLASRLGGFEVTHEAAYSSVSGSVADGVVPDTILDLVGESGPCQLLRRNNPYCDPPCGAGQACDHDGTCIPYPSNVGVGTVTISGLLAPVEMEPSAAGKVYFETGLPHPAFDPGEPILLTAAGGELPHFVLDGVGVEPLEGADSTWSLATGTALTVTWTAAADTRTTILAALNVDQHGTAPVTMVCETADTGSLEIAASLVDDLLAAGISGLPHGSLHRRTTDSTEVSNGCVELLVSSHQPVEVIVQ
jgi:hypothetical protein